LEISSGALNANASNADIAIIANKEERVETE
jgi:hypothetical protein